MNLEKDLEKLGAKIEANGSKLEVFFGNKTDFIKHKIKLNNLNIQFDETKKSFILDEQDKDLLESFIKTITLRPTIIFDMDGVIVNTTNSFNVATIKTYYHFTKKELTSKEINEIKYQGGFNSDWDILMHLFKKDCIDIKFEDMAKYYMDLYFDGKGGLIDDEPLILTKAHINELLENYNLAVFTGRDTESAMYTLRKWDLEEYFYPIITFECVGINHQKPDTKGVSIIKEKVIANEIYYLGDTVDDMMCARNSSVKGIGVLPPRDKSDKLRSRLLEEGAITCLETTTDLSKFLTERLELITKM